MTPPKKPEWFELRDYDNNSRHSVKKNPFKRGALLAALFIAVGVAAVAAQVGEESPAEAENVVATATAPDTTIATPSAPSAGDVPAIAKLPSKSRGGDGDDDFGDGDHDGFKPRHHEGGEDHEFEGDDD